MKTSYKSVNKKIIANRIKDLNSAEKNKISNKTMPAKALFDGINIGNMLENQDQKYRSLYELSPDLLRTIDNNCIIIDCNETYAKSLGYSKDEIIGKSIFEHTAEKSYNDIKESVTIWEKTGKIVNKETWLKRKDGTIFPTLLSGTNIYDQNGGVTGRTVSLRDITDVYESRKILEEKDRNLQKKLQELRLAHDIILETEVKYRALYDFAPVLYRTIDLGGIILQCNKSYAKSLGYSKDEIIGKSIFEHTAEKSYNDIKESFQPWSTKGMVSEHLIWLKRKDGTIFPTMLSATTIYNEKGELIGSNTIIRDISDIYSAKQEAAEQKLKRLSAIGELSARVAHDLRNPLAVIKNAITLIKKQNPNLDSSTLYKISFIDDAIMRMSHQIDEVLDFVKPKSLSITPTTTTKIINNVMYRIAIPDNVTINLPSNSIDIMCDISKMEIVFVNLISNAIQAMNSHGTINIRTTEKNERVQFEVEDTGHGIPLDILPKIFDPLFTTRQVGTGLGLSSCKSIVEKHGGKIKVETVIEKGTTFIITIPKSTQQ